MRLGFFEPGALIIMELKALKLFNINHVLQTQDQQVLETVANLLTTAHMPTSPVANLTPDWELEEDYRSQYSEEHTRELQRSIDELFNP